MTIETVRTCPLGSKCEEIKDGKIHQCAWYVRIAGTNPQDGTPTDEKECAIAWMPILQIEMSNTNRGQSAAIESFRNESVKRMDLTNIIMATATGQAPQLIGDDGRILLE